MFSWEGRWEGARWYGPEQKEDKSITNVKRCFAFLKSRPYLSQEDRERIGDLEVIAVLKAPR